MLLHQCSCHRMTLLHGSSFDCHCPCQCPCHCPCCPLLSAHVPILPAGFFAGTRLAGFFCRWLTVEESSLPYACSLADAEKESWLRLFSLPNALASCTHAFDRSSSFRPEGLPFGSSPKVPTDGRSKSMLSARAQSSRNQLSMPL